MKYVDEFRDGALARLAAAIAAAVAPGRTYRLMEFCGGHTHAISRYGLEDLLPDAVRMTHGPGCPVCVLPMARIDMAVALARNSAITLCIYGDLMRVPGSSNGSSLMKAKAEGADIRMVYSALDVIRIAEAEPAREVVFFAIGFETTTPPTALAIRAGQKKGLTNLSVFCNHVMTPPAMRAILEGSERRRRPHPAADRRLRRPRACQHDHRNTGLRGDRGSVRQADRRRRLRTAGRRASDLDARSPDQSRPQGGREPVRASCDARRKYPRAGRGRRRLRDPPSFDRRGLGWLLASALRLRPEFARFDAERTPVETPAKDNPGLANAGRRWAPRPRATVGCSARSARRIPNGLCMVSPEGACSAHWTYGRFRENAARQRVSQAA